MRLLENLPREIPKEDYTQFGLPFSLYGITLPSWKKLPSFQGYSGNIEITVGLSCWNREGTVAASIESICNQNFPKEAYELIIVDDISTDDSRTIIKDTIAKYPNNLIRYYELETNRTFNEHHPHNVTIRKALGKIFLKLSADCMLSRNYLEGTWRHHQRREDLFLHCYWANSNIIRKNIDVDFETKKELYYDILLRTGLNEDILVNEVNPELPKAHEGRHVIDTGASMFTHYWKDMHGFNESIIGNVAGDVEVMCRCNYYGLYFGYDPGLIMVHEHLSTKPVKRGMTKDKGGSNVPWEPKEFVKNKNGYGQLTGSEEDNCIKSPAFINLGI